MGILARIFEPIVGFSNVDLDAINVVVFDTNGTLVHLNRERNSRQIYVADANTAELLRNLKARQSQLGLEEIVIISSDPKQATAALEDAGLGSLITAPIEDRTQFYCRVGGKVVLAVDDEFLLAMEAQAYVNPKTQKVQDYLGARTYMGEFGIN